MIGVGMSAVPPLSKKMKSDGQGKRLGYFGELTVLDLVRVLE